jgi:hypothetical protein
MRDILILRKNAIMLKNGHSYLQTPLGERYLLL